MTEYLFYFFSAIAIFSGILVVIGKNPIHSILFLILTFLSSSCLLLLLNVEFLAFLFLVVYVGAIAVLFLFVVMMLNIKVIAQTEVYLRYLPIGGFIALIFLFELFYIMRSNFIFINPSLNFETIKYVEWISLSHALTNVQMLANIMYTYYFHLFLIASLILLVAMVGAIILTLSQRLHVKRQDSFKQISRSLANSITLYK